MDNRTKGAPARPFRRPRLLHELVANWFRLLLSSLAYTVAEALRRTGIRDTKLARAQCRTIRIRLLKIGVVVTCSLRTLAVWRSGA